MSAEWLQPDTSLIDPALEACWLEMPPAWEQFARTDFRPAAPAAAEATPQPPTTQRAHKWIAGLSLCGVVGAGMADLGPQQIVTSAVRGGTAVIESFTNPQCPAPSPTAAHEAKQLLNPLTDLPQSIYNLSQPYDPNALAKAPSFANRQEIAQELHLTVRDDAPFTADLQVDVLQPEPQLPASLYFERASTFLNQYGITLRPGGPLEQYDSNFRQSSQAELTSATTKKGLFNLMRTISDMPQEYIVGLGGVRELVLASAEAENDEIVLGYNQDDVIYLNVKALINALTIRHEVFHSIDRRLCGGQTAMDNDPTIEDFNNGMPAAPSLNEPNRLSYIDFVGRHAAALKAYRNEKAQGENPLKVNQLRDYLLHPRRELVTITDISYYGETATAESKAEAGAIISEYNGDTFDYTWILSAPSPLRDKFITLVARLIDHGEGNIVRYFVQTNTRDVTAK